MPYPARRPAAPAALAALLLATCAPGPVDGPVGGPAPGPGIAEAPPAQHAWPSRGPACAAILLLHGFGAAREVKATEIGISVQAHTDQSIFLAIFDPIRIALTLAHRSPSAASGRSFQEEPVLRPVTMRVTTNDPGL